MKHQTTAIGGRLVAGAKLFTFGSLFAGIGGMDLGLERAGMTCSWQVEIDPYAQRVLAKHWPDVRRHDDVKTFPPSNPEDWTVDLICGGFPCQDISYAGKGAGLDGERSGLWYEYARVIRVLRPHFVLVENVSALLVRGLDAVLGTLASLGYDSEWRCIPASAVGAPHIRDRVFILANTIGQRKLQPQGLVGQERGRPRNGREEMAHADGIGRRAGRSGGTSPSGEVRQSPGSDVLDAAILRGQPNDDQWWATEPDVGRVAHGVPARMDRLRGLGNAVVPQVAEFIGRRIMETAS